LSEYSSRNETQIENAGVNLLNYVAPGDDHLVLIDGLFYTETVNGEKLVDWVAGLIEGNRLMTYIADNAASAERPSQSTRVPVESPAASRPGNGYDSLTLSRAWRADRAGSGWRRSACLARSS
jgi:hypothetical protein